MAVPISRTRRYAMCAMAQRSRTGYRKTGLAVRRIRSTLRAGRRVSRMHGIFPIRLAARVVCPRAQAVAEAAAVIPVAVAVVAAREAGVIPVVEAALEAAHLLRLLHQTREVGMAVVRSCRIRVRQPRRCHVR